MQNLDLILDGEVIVRAWRFGESRSKKNVNSGDHEITSRRNVRSFQIRFTCLRDGRKPMRYGLRMSECEGWQQQLFTLRSFEGLAKQLTCYHREKC